MQKHGGAKFTKGETDDEKAQNKKAAKLWNCGSLYFAQGASGIIHAFGADARKETIYDNNFCEKGQKSIQKIPTFWGIELPAILGKNMEADIVFHFNDGFVLDPIKKDKVCHMDKIEKYYVKAKNTYTKYIESNQKYPDYTDLVPLCHQISRLGGKAGNTTASYQ